MTNFSFQLYSARAFPSLENTLKMLAQAGYKETEGYGGVYDDPTATRAAHDAVGLSMTSGHFSVDALSNDREGCLKAAEILGVSSIYAPFLLPDERPTDTDGYINFAKRLEALCAIYTAEGYTFGWHNHDFEFATLPDGSIPMTHILANAPSISWEADIAWVVRGGADVLQWINDYSDRITAIHIKDIAPNGDCLDEDGWADVGHGTMDWPGLMTAVSKTSAKHFVMEHDNPNDLARFATRSINNIKNY